MEKNSKKINDLIEVLNNILNDKNILNEIDKIANLLTKVSLNKNKFFLLAMGKRCRLSTFSCRTCRKI